MEPSEHLLSLKVMRVSRPTLASAWQPFFSTSPSFSAHSSASILSLQGKAPLIGHPKTLRDLTSATEFLTLPSSFGAIQLGETFSSCLSVNNEVNIDIEAVTVRVEIQTMNTKTLVAELGGPDFKLTPGQSLEHVVQHEVKELGQHVLACAVSYRMPSHTRPSAVPAAPGADPNLQTLRKFYKFAVTNPLSVKTKVHVPKSPTASLLEAEREKVFLEVHVQNLTQEPLWFEKIRFECAESWKAIDTAGTEPSKSYDEELFTDDMSLMQPQDVRQYIYTLVPAVLSTFPLVHPPGTVIALGRLDISWRSQFGELGRLLTSMLSRRIPLPAPQQARAPPPITTQQLQQPHQPASAVPSYLYRSSPATPSSPARALSPQLPSRPTSPSIPSRPGSPFNKGRATPRAQSPSNTSVGLPPVPQIPPIPDLLPYTAQPPNLDIGLVLLDMRRDDIRVEHAFTATFRLSIGGPAPRTHTGKRRIVQVAVQHVQTRRAVLVPGPDGTLTSVSRVDAFGFPAPSPTMMSRIAEAMEASPRPLYASPKHMSGGMQLPSPYDDRPGIEGTAASASCHFLGSSTQVLPPIQLSLPEGSASDAQTEDTDGPEPKGAGSWEFTLAYMPTQTGFARVGGVRIILTKDELIDEEVELNEHLSQGSFQPRLLKEIECVAEVWVNP